MLLKLNGVDASGTINAQATAQLASHNLATPRVVYKVRLSTAELDDWNGTEIDLFGLFNSAATQSSYVLRVRSYYDGTNIVIRHSGNGFTNTSVTIAAATLLAHPYVILYGHVQAATQVYEVYAPDGTVLGTTSGAVGAAPPTSRGWIVLGNFLGTTTKPYAGHFDAVAFYTRTLSGAERYSEPTAADWGIESLHTFEDGSGSTAANSVSGGPSLSLTGHSWEAGGEWDGNPGNPLEFDADVSHGGGAWAPLFTADAGSPASVDPSGWPEGSSQVRLLSRDTVTGEVSGYATNTYTVEGASEAYTGALAGAAGAAAADFASAYTPPMYSGALDPGAVAAEAAFAGTYTAPAVPVYAGALAAESGGADAALVGTYSGPVAAVYTGALAAVSQPASARFRSSEGPVMIQIRRPARFTFQI